MLIAFLWGKQAVKRITKVRCSYLIDILTLSVSILSDNCVIPLRSPCIVFLFSPSKVYYVQKATISDSFILVNVLLQLLPDSVLSKNFNLIAQVV